MEVPTVHRFVCGVFLTACLAYVASGLECYNCTSIEDPKCGVAYDFTGSAGDKYMVPCEGGTVACRKLVTKDAYKGKEFVVRSCWNVTDILSLEDEFYDCKKLMGNTGQACYCKGNKCNGGQLVQYSTLTVVGGLSFLVVLLWNRA